MNRNGNMEYGMEEFESSALFMQVEQEELETSYSGSDVFCNFSAGQMELDPSKKVF